MSWWSELVDELAQAIRSRPFERRVVIAPSPFARRSLRAELATQIGALDLPVSGLSIVAPHELPELFELRGQLRSNTQLRVALLEAFAADSSLLGHQALGGWRDQLQLAQALLNADLEAVEPEQLQAAFAHRPRLLTFMGTVLRTAQACSGDSALSLAEAAPTPSLKAWSLPLPPLPYRLQALIARLSPKPLSQSLEHSGYALTGRSHDQLAQTAIESLERQDHQRIALVVLDPALMAPLERYLIQAQKPWASAQRVGLGWDPDQRSLAKLEIVDCPDPKPLEVWRAQLPSEVSQRVLDAADELCTLGSIELAGGAFIDELQRTLGRGRPSLGWPQASLHLLDGSAWPDSAYDHVLLLGAQRGYLAHALAQHAPFINPGDRRTFRRIGLDAFDPEAALTRERQWLDAWRAASETVSIGWMTHDAKGRKLAADRWAVALAEGLHEIAPAEQPLDRIAAPMVKALDWQADEPDNWYPTTVSDMLRCPRQAFLKRELKLRGTQVNEGLELFSDAMWTGTMLHLIVERTTRPMIGKPELLDGIESALQQTTRRELARHTPAISEGLQAVLSDSLMVRLRPLIEFIDEGQIQQILGVEKRVPEGSSSSELHARCDLIIQNHEGQRVLLDLKSGAAKTADTLREDEALGKNLQRAAYLNADPSAERAAMFYLGGGHSPYLSIDRSDLQIPWALEALRRARKHYEVGAFPMAGLAGNDACGDCEVRAACRRFDEDWLDQLSAMGPAFEGTVRGAVKKGES